jgi:hypothetical protein
MIFLLLCFSAQSKAAESDISKLFNDLPYGITRDTDQDGRSRTEFFKAVKIHKDGFYIQEVGEDLVLLLERSSNIAIKQATLVRRNFPENLNCTLDKSFRQTGSIAEQKFRQSHRFETTTRKAALLTVIQTKLAKFNVIFPQYLVNNKIGERDTVITLAVNKKLSARGLWSAVWAEADKMFELHLETGIDPQGNPTYTVSELKGLIRSVNCV